MRGALLVLLAAMPVEAAELQAVATLPDLASLVTAVGGADVETRSLARGGDDPHFVEPRPSFIRSLHDADLLVYTGLELELGWLPALVGKARNSGIQPGRPGHVDASDAIPPLEVPSGRVDRSMGDIHRLGNPHYLLDPANGIRVARLLAERITVLRPELAEPVAIRRRTTEEKIARACAGDAWVERIGSDAVVEALLATGPPAELRTRLAASLPAGAEVPPLAGWIGRLAPFEGARVVADHNLWPYFARRFGISVVGFLEPVPGIAPSTGHLSELAEQIRAERIPVILSSVYFNPRHAQKLSQASGAAVVLMANQVGSREGTDDYLDMLDWNVRHLADALEAAQR